MNNPETYGLTGNRLNTYMVLYFSDLNEAQIYKMTYRNSPHHEIDKVMSFKYLNLFKPNEHKEDYQIRSPSDEKFLFQTGDKEYSYNGDKIVTSETNDKLVKYSSAFGFNGNKYSFAYG